MRHTRTALARLFTNLACLVLPEGMPEPYERLIQASWLLRYERMLQKLET